MATILVNGKRWIWIPSCVGEWGDGIHLNIDNISEVMRNTEDDFKIVMNNGSEVIPIGVSFTDFMDLIVGIENG